LESLGPATAQLSGLKRVVIIADSSLTVEVLRLGLQKSGEFEVVGRAHWRRTSPETILAAQADLILVDDMDRCEGVVGIIRALTAEGQVPLIVLCVQMDDSWLERIFAAGATGAVSKATQPRALTTLLRETLNGNVVHQFRGGSSETAAGAAAARLTDLPLTPRELEILQLVASGSSNSGVARQLWVTEQTVKFHLRNIYRKLDVANRTQASHFAYVNGLVDPAEGGEAKRELAAVS
jgi:DNA-binding NarL/FixJ family response regulator